MVIEIYFISAKQIEIKIVTSKEYMANNKYEASYWETQDEAMLSETMRIISECELSTTLKLHLEMTLHYVLNYDIPII